MSDRIQGLYAITDALMADGLIEGVRQAIIGGARLIQYRDKSGDQARRLSEAQQLKRLCEESNTLLIINDDVGLAKQVAAHGVHIGRHDANLRQAREALGKRAIIGTSCYNQLSLAQQAQDAGADYVAFGRFFPSQTKPDAAAADPALLDEAKHHLSVPIVAIGGITQDNGAQLIQHGADALAVIRAVFDQDDIATAAKGIAELFTS